MVNDSIFVIGADGGLTEVFPATFEKELDFQQLITTHPELLRLAAGEDSDLLLVSPEFRISGVEGGADNRRVDHLFLDRQGVPVLVEVKRKGDARVRREVFAQLVDYASHASAAWKVGLIEERFRKACKDREQDPDKLLHDFLPDLDVAGFWMKVEANLDGNRLRMVVVTDRVGPELGRMVEFLNEEMKTSEILAIELALFKGGNGTLTLVPRLVGATARAEAVKATVDAPGKNYSGLVDFESAKEMSRIRENAVVIGFAGGRAKLKHTSKANLEKRSYKWDHAEGGRGTKMQGNWLSGPDFLDAVASKD